MKRVSLLWKFTLAFLLVAIIAAVLVAVLIRLTSADRLSRLIIDQQLTSLQSTLVTYYTENGSWATAQEDWGQLQFRARPTQIAVNPQGTALAPDSNNFGRPFPDNNGNGRVDRRSLFGLADEQGQVLVSVDPSAPVGSILPKDQLKAGTPVIVNGKQVGTILPGHFPPGFNAEENLFLQRTTDALILAAAGAMLVALFIGLILARTLIRPIQALTDAAQNMSRGHLDQQVKVTSKDEIGQLGEAFNTMSQEVARVNRLRKQMTADIAHDLRTPLTVISGYVESMRDGVLAPTPQRLSIIYAEIDRLQNLVGDLKMLSQVDAGELPLHPQYVPAEQVLEHAAAPFQHKAEQQKVDLEIEIPENVPDLFIDESRMMQVFGNLLSNALRYTPEGGKISLSAKRTDGHVDLVVTDTGEGIAEDELPLIFDRFHRADQSRHADNGESGLGLAIVKALVEAHGGSVRAESAPGAGTAVLISLPVK
jgi:two-component system, OmpR family, sensor histidine kinase BaeS